ncbi:hypothetical protein [Streptomyces sp. NPDC053720]
MGGSSFCPYSNGSCDKAIKTMKQTGDDMKIKYKQTSRGGLAVNVNECGR